MADEKEYTWDGKSDAGSPYTFTCGDEFILQPYGNPAQIKKILVSVFADPLTGKPYEIRKIIPIKGRTIVWDTRINLRIP